MVPVEGPTFSQLRVTSQLRGALPGDRVGGITREQPGRTGCAPGATGFAGDSLATVKTAGEQGPGAPGAGVARGGGASGPLRGEDGGCSWERVVNSAQPSAPLQPPEGPFALCTCPLPSLFRHE